MSTYFSQVYYTKIYENTGELGMLEIDNLCKSFQRGSLESGVKNFVLYKLAYTYFCPIKKVKHNKYSNNKLMKIKKKISIFSVLQKLGIR